jgi:hypothetical protein
MYNTFSVVNFPERGKYDVSKRSAAEYIPIGKARESHADWMTLSLGRHQRCIGGLFLFVVFDDPSSPADSVLRGGGGPGS